MSYSSGRDLSKYASDVRDAIADGLKGKLPANAVSNIKQFTSRGIESGARAAQNLVKNVVSSITPTARAGNLSNWGYGGPNPPKYNGQTVTGLNSVTKNKYQTAKGNTYYTGPVTKVFTSSTDPNNGANPSERVVQVSYDNGTTIRSQDPQNLDPQRQDIINDYMGRQGSQAYDRYNLLGQDLGLGIDNKNSFAGSVKDLYDTLPLGI